MTCKDKSFKLSLGDGSVLTYSKSLSGQKALVKKVDKVDGKITGIEVGFELVEEEGLQICSKTADTSLVLGSMKGPIKAG